MRSSRLVLIFARPPREERREKPLVASALKRRVEALHHALFRRTLAVARAAGFDTRLVTTGEVPPSLAIAGLQIVQQRGGTFAERLEHAVADAFKDGWRQVVVIGGDTPGLDAGHLRDAFAGLGAFAEPRAVVGPACDGGYYLLGLNAFVPAAFRDVPFGSTDAGRATIDALAAAGLSIATLPKLRDVDDEADVRALAGQGGALRALVAALLAPRAAPLHATRTMRARLFETTIQARGPPLRPSLHP